MKKSKKNTLLWKITNIKSGIESYIFGTIHLRDERVYFRINEIKELIRSCEVFMAEYPLDDAGDIEVMQMLQFADGKHLKDFIPTKKYNKLSEIILKSFKVDLDRLGYFKPMVIENILTESMFENDFEFPMDIVLWNYAKEIGLYTIGAESTKSQIDIMRRMSVKQQVKSLVSLGKNPKRFRSKIKKLIALYEKQNLPELHKKSVKSLSKLKDLLVYNRNRNIVKSILKDANGKKVFVAIGAGHLFGKKGILKLLKNNGYKVKPIK